MAAESAGRAYRCAHLPGRRRDQLGETLIESLVAILVISMVAIAAYSGLQTALRVSVQHREQAVAETLLRSAAERLQDSAGPYVPLAGCAGAGDYADLPTAPGYGPVTTGVRFWVPPTDVTSDVTTQFGATGTCPATDPGLQAIELQVVTPAGHVETLEILKRSA